MSTTDCHCAVAYGNRSVIQLLLTSTECAGFAGLAGGRNLLQAPGEAALGKKFANKATAYAVTLILIWFTFAGVYCMVSMHFKQDTLLYGRSKTD